MRHSAAFGVGWNVVIVIYDGTTGAIRNVLRGHNLVVNTGLAAIAAGLAGTAPTITHIAFGTGSNPPAAGDTALQSELARYPIAVVTSSGAVATAQHRLSSGLLVGSNIREVGLFATSTLIARFTFSDPDLLPKGAVSVITTWTLTGSAT